MSPPLDERSRWHESGTKGICDEQQDEQQPDSRTSPPAEQALLELPANTQFVGAFLSRSRLPNPSTKALLDVWMASRA